MLLVNEQRQFVQIVQIELEIRSRAEHYRWTNSLWQNISNYGLARRNDNSVRVCRS